MAGDVVPIGFESPEFLTGSNPSVSGGGRARVVLSESPHGGFSEGMGLGRMELQERSKGRLTWGINPERVRHRVSPKTTQIRPPVISPPVNEGLQLTRHLFLFDSLPALIYY